MHSDDPQSGLSKTVSEEILVQYLVKVDPKLRMDVTPGALASRVRFSEGGRLGIQVTNLLPESAAFRIDFDIRPEAAKNAVNISSVTRDLVGKEKVDLAIDFSLNKQRLKTIDGTIDLIIHAKPK